VKQVKSRVRKVKSMLIIFFYIKRIVSNEFALIGQTVNSTYYCGILWWLHENVQRLCLELWRQKNSCYIMTMHHLTLPFQPGILGQTQHECHLPPTQVSAPWDFSISLTEDTTILT
jgi:hypothetical protein